MRRHIRSILPAVAGVLLVLIVLFASPLLAEREVAVVNVVFDATTQSITFPDGGDVVIREHGSIRFSISTVGSTESAVLTGITFPAPNPDPAGVFSPDNGGTYGATTGSGDLMLNDHCPATATYSYCLHLQFAGQSYSSDPKIMNEPPAGN